MNQSAIKIIRGGRKYGPTLVYSLMGFAILFLYPLSAFASIHVDASCNITWDTLADTGVTNSLQAVYLTQPQAVSPPYINAATAFGSLYSQTYPYTVNATSALHGKGYSGTYYFDLWDHANGGSPFQYNATFGTLVYNDATQTCTPVNPPVTNTRIVSVTPAGNATVATSSAGTIGVDVYVNANDYTTGQYVEIKYASLSADQASVASPNLLFTVLDFPITASGDNNLSTTSPILTQGQYTMQTTLYSPNGIIGSVLNWFGGLYGNSSFGDTSIIATSTTFVAGSLSGYDIFVASTTASISAYLASSTISLASCSSFTSFNLGDCLNLIFVPQVAPIQQVFTNFKDGFLTYAPWGYITRFISIFTGGATTSLPTFTYTAGSSSPAILQAAGPLTIDFFNSTWWGEVTAIKADDGSGKDIWDIIDPYFTMLVAFSVLFVVLEELVGIEFTGLSNREDADGFSDRQKYQIEGMKQQQRTNYPYGRGRVGYDKKGKNL